MAIKNIIFDLGGVILNLDYSKTQRAFENLGVKSIDSFFSQAKQNSLFDDLETDRATPDDFRNAIRQETGITATDEEIDKAWNAMLLDCPTYRIDLLKEYRKTHNLYLLSNTNRIHYPEVDRIMGETFGVASLEPYFDKLYLSYDVGLRKPNTDIYEYVLADAGIKAEESIFLDDSIHNLPPAEQVGIKTIFVDRPISKEMIDAKLRG